MLWRNRSRMVLGTIALCLTVLSGNVHSARTGKIIGTVTDKDTKEPVIGASVQIVGTTQGGSSDVNGKYTIGQVEAGTYRLKVSHIRYKSVEITNVQVQSDLNTQQDMALETGATELQAIVVTAQKDPINRREVHSAQTLTAEQIDVQPVTTVADLLTQVAGVVTGREGEIFIRGGRAGEVSYILDGVPIDDPLARTGGRAGANLSLVAGSIQEFTVIKDGFDPEYGDAVSGIINITTQTGSKDNTRMNTQFITDDFGNHDLNRYSRNNDFLRFSLSGPDPILKSRVLPALGLNFLRDKEFTYYLYSEVEKGDGFYQYSQFDTPKTRRTSNFFDMFGIRIPERLENRYHWMLNLKFRPQQNLKFIISYKDTQTRNTLFRWGYRFSSATAPVQETKLKVASAEVSHALTKNMSYEAIISYALNEERTRPGDPDNPGHGIDPPDIPLEEEWETYDDNNKNGVYDPPEPIINLYPDTTTYGTDFTGPRYTFGEDLIDENIQSGTRGQSRFRFNDNPIVDNFEGEPFIDLNGNNVWDRGDFLRDRNGNGLLDAGRVPSVRSPLPEPYVDGDSVIGERFVDVNSNDLFDEGVDLFTKCNCPQNMDLNHNGKYDGPLDRWTPGTRYIDRNGNGLYDYPNFQYDPGEPFTDRNGNGRWDAGGSSNFFDPLTYDEDATWHFRRIHTYRGELKLYREIGAHQFKAGAAVRRYDFVWQQIEKPYRRYTGRNDGGPYPDRGDFRDMFAYQPWQGTVYFRDKLEYGSMIASLGLRWDFFVQDKERLIPVARNDDLGSGVILGDRQKISPRIGFSYPISDKAKVHFNYGHFYQMEELRYMYERNTASVDQSRIVGNYNLDYKKTVQYSFGVKYAMTQDYAVDISGYFKDEFDKVNAAEVVVGGLTRQQYRNSDYGRSRGFELTMEKTGGGYVNGIVSYVFAYAYGKASEAARVYLTPFEISREPLAEAALDNDVRHKLNATIQIFVPGTVKPKLFGLPIPNNWSLAVVTRVESGRPFTPDRDYPGISRETREDIQRNSLRMPSVLNFDVRFTKDFKFVGLDCSGILWVENVFNSRNVVFVYKNTGRPDTQQNQSQIIKGGTEYDLNPANWDYGRQLRLGLEVNL
ncbi:MAG TPA: carboxypeptidase-like regulatory domain-containing protein [Candidatus Deferrimicrobium sp.]|nr:carboxypeptidase-like regulatory domain-containing protein [Candidatus Deferrimicrobium sp.]